jgi:hypothetical protein
MDTKTTTEGMVESVLEEAGGITGASRASRLAPTSFPRPCEFSGPRQGPDSGPERLPTDAERWRAPPGTPARRPFDPMFCWEPREAQDDADMPSLALASVVHAVAGNDTLQWVSKYKLP